MYFTISIFFGYTVILRLFGISCHKSKTIFQDEWKWSKITPTADLIWHRCFKIYDCARLDVPLDWMDPSDDLRASIAVIRYNATDRKNYQGPVFINPGGPGGSGVWFLKKLAPYYQIVVGRNHDIISFDPRGVGATTPRIDCWDSDYNSKIWDLTTVDVIDAHPGALYDAYAHATAFSQQCASKTGGGAHLQNTLVSPAENRVAEAGPGRFVSTASVARDMLEIMEKVGEEKLRYWGFSYGTVIGTTFASLFPDRIERMVNDGNVDVVEYTSGRGTHFVQDTDKVMDSFYQFCHRAGPQNCSFYAPSPREIEIRLDMLLKRIRKHPVIVPASPSGGRPEVVSFSGLRKLIASALYRPLFMFPPLAEILSALEEDDGKPFIELTRQGSGDPLLCERDPGPSPEHPEAEGTEDASKAILCSDAAPVRFTVDEFGKYVDELAQLSKSAGATMANMLLDCVGWTVDAKWRFDGPFKGNTSFPILFIANMADNVTPLRSAQQNAQGFPGSVIMIQDSYGHTSINTPSKCTAKTIRAYFQNGTLPASGAICDPDLVPFEKWNLTSSPEIQLDINNESDDSELDAALLNLMVGSSLWT